MNNKLNCYQYQPPVPMFSMAQFGRGLDESFWEDYRQKSQGWADAAEQLKPPIRNNSINIARTLSMAANLAILGSFAHFYLRTRKTKNGKVVVERVRKKDDYH